MDTAVKARTSAEVHCRAPDLLSDNTEEDERLFFTEIATVEKSVNDTTTLLTARGFQMVRVVPYDQFGKLQNYD